MQGNRAANTVPELRIRRELFRLGLRYRVNTRIITPEARIRADIVFPRQRVAVFVDGCFWHGCPDHGTKPSQNRTYWDAKIARNQQRDAAYTRALLDDHWTVIRAWEHDDPVHIARRVHKAVKSAGRRS